MGIMRLVLEKMNDELKLNEFLVPIKLYQLRF